MRSGVQTGLLGIALVVSFGTSAWTISEIGKNSRAIHQLSERSEAAFDVLNAKADQLRSTAVGHEHSDVRRFVIAGHLARTVSPIVVLGDSITEAATLPEMICGHAVVNAGIGGAGVDDLLAAAPLLLRGKALALVVVAVGTNDAYATERREDLFNASFAKLLQSLAKVAPKLAVANIPPIAPNLALVVAAHLDSGLIDRFNLLLPKLAEKAGASFIDLHTAVTAKGQPETLDGIHLAPSAYDLWDAAMLTGIKKALDCGRDTNGE
jgi:lysophospholipase L1-like esterase